MSHPVTTIDLIRHGMPEGGPRYRGWLDDPLSEEGWLQMSQALEGEQPWDQIISSSLIRCASFAQQLGEKIARPVLLEEGFREISFGAWEGRTAAEIFTETPEAISRFWRDPVNFPPPDGEALDQFAQRINNAWSDLTTRYSGQHILLVSHGGVIRMIIGQVLGMPLNNLFRLEVPMAAISQIRIEDGLPRLVFHAK
ncbi:MAG: histidine phosphatase family protein [Candidatus Polarisedimenticolaceae bacterium]|nr:histidine phosphatase family protein [Candidatus Polarisedimenticolaceae bacterium]